MEMQLSVLQSMKPAEDGSDAIIDVGDDSSDMERIEHDPRGAALNYLKLVKTVQKEYKILLGSQDKLQHAYDELKRKNDEVKIVARESAEEVLSMESRICELEDQNRKLLSDIEKCKGSSSTIDGHSIRASVEEDFSQKLAYKDSEIEAANTKLSRISQSNIEMKTKCDRLEASNFELSNENEQNRIKLQTLEMELEMTKVNVERESE